MSSARGVSLIAEFSGVDPQSVVDNAFSGRYRAHTAVAYSAWHGWQHTMVGSTLPNRIKFVGWNAFRDTRSL